MDITVKPAKLTGEYAPPPSKSAQLRAILAAGLSGGCSKIISVSQSDDVKAMTGAVAALGAMVIPCVLDGRQSLSIIGRDDTKPPVIDCGESAAVLRFLLPVMLAVFGEAAFTGRGRLFQRPIQPYMDAIPGLTVDYTADGMSVSGRLAGGIYSLPGDVSSQFISGMLFALPLLETDSELRLTTEIVGRGYVDMTLDTLSRFGISVTESEGVFAVRGSQFYRGADITCEGDASHAAFFLTANALGSKVRIALPNDSLQGDTQAEMLIRKITRESVIDLGAHPDLVPPLAILAASIARQTTFTGISRLKHKESDRLATVVKMLKSLGVYAVHDDDSILIDGVKRIAGGTVDSCGDHRIAMTAAIAATTSKRGVTVLGAECVSKSYPDFWDVFAKLGGSIE